MGIVFYVHVSAELTVWLARKVFVAKVLIAKWGTSGRILARNQLSAAGVARELFSFLAVPVAASFVKIISCHWNILARQ